MPEIAHSSSLFGLQVEQTTLTAAASRQTSKQQVLGPNRSVLPDPSLASQTRGTMSPPPPHDRAYRARTSLCSLKRSSPRSMMMRITHFARGLAVLHAPIARPSSHLMARRKSWPIDTGIGIMPLSRFPPCRPTVKPPGPTALEIKPAHLRDTDASDCISVSEFMLVYSYRLSNTQIINLQNQNRKHPGPTGGVVSLSPS
ncbi:hypothetical protein LX36DRAFT_372447 [Colletotrichum falcatum]|nr:hypothetical protein LX36DRAFT_372447 [Colletotrichum falcatum]